jgi:ATP-dependent DNA ligase
MSVDVPPPKTTRFGTPLVLSRVHWVRPELVAEVTYLTCTADGLLRHVVYEGLRAPLNWVLRWLALPLLFVNSNLINVD